MILNHELHLHLHGCVEADDFWMLAKTTYLQNLDRLTWFADEFEKQWGRRPHIDKYFSDLEYGFAYFKKDYELKNYVNFPQFQAKFNLLIALLPIQPTDTSLIEFVLKKQGKRGLRYGEYRMALPLDFDEQQTHTYLSHAMKAFQKIHQQFNDFEPKAVLSLNRDNKILFPTYEYVKNWQKNHADLSEYLVGIDFGNYEESFGPETKKVFLKKVLKDNKDTPSLALAVLYHVGESFKTIGIEKSIAWVTEAARMGCHRLGHCIALGVDPTKIIGSDFDGDRDHILRLQEQAMKSIKSTNTVIESCPTSNVRIAGIASTEFHPLPRFLANDLPTVISTDDPGIFGITLQEEEALCRNKLGISPEKLSSINHTAIRSKSEILSGRHA